MAHRAIALLIGVLLLTTLAYGPVSTADFAYEDRNPTFGIASDAQWPDYRVPWQGWRAEFSVWVPHNTLGRVGPTPRLLTSLSYRLNMWADATPRGFHLTNLAIHLLNGVLLFVVAAPLGLSIALVSVTLFLLHPLNSEAVSYISARPDLLLCTAVLLMLWASERSTWPRVALVAACGALAVLAKETGVVVIGLLPLWLWYRRAWTPRWWLPLGIWAVGGLAVAYRLLHVSAAGVARPWGAVGAYTSDAAHGLMAYAAYQAFALLRLAGLVVWPRGFSIDPDIEAQPLLVAGLALAIVCSVAILAWQRRHESRAFAFAIGWLLVSLSLRFVFPMPEYLHEQHAYVPFLSVWLALAVGAVRVSDWIRDHHVVWTEIAPNHGAQHG